MGEKRVKNQPQQDKKPVFLGRLRQQPRPGF
jgi:hypothetical protein